MSVYITPWYGSYALDIAEYKANYLIIQSIC